MQVERNNSRSVAKKCFSYQSTVKRIKKTAVKKQIKYVRNTAATAKSGVEQHLVIQEDNQISREYITKIENDFKFAEFIKDVPHRIKENKMSFDYGMSLGYYLIGYPALMYSFDKPAEKQISSHTFEIDSFFGKIRYFRIELPYNAEFIFDDGVYQEFYFFYKKSLRFTENLCLKSSFVEFLIRYMNPKEISDSKDKTLQLEKEFLKHNGIFKETRKTSAETLRADKMQKDGLSWRQIAQIFLMEKTPNTSLPKTPNEKRRFRDALDSERARIANSVGKFRKRKINHKVSENLFSHMGKLFGFLRIGEKSFLITSRDK